MGDNNNNNALSPLGAVGYIDDNMEKSFLTFSTRVSHIFSEFMARTAEFDDLVGQGHRFLIQFQQNLDILRRPPVHTVSKVADIIIKTNCADKMNSYVEAGCIHVAHRAQSIRNLHYSMEGLWECKAKEKALLRELECLMEDAIRTIEKLNQELDQGMMEFLDEHCINGIKHQSWPLEEEKRTELLFLQNESSIRAIMLATVFRMLKLDFNMEEKIVDSIAESSSSELESYCQMWTLRPYVNDEVMKSSWKLVNVNQGKG